MEQTKRKNYTEAQLRAALTAIEQGASVYETSKTYCIPRTTLRDKRSNKYSNEVCGVQPVLNRDEEKRIVDWIHYLGKMGFPVTREQLLETVAKLIQNLNRPSPFKDGVPGRHWYQNFLSRHPTVSKRVTQNLPTSRNQITEEAVRAWFSRVLQHFDQNNLLEVFEDPSRIFNCDESGFFLCPKEKQVLVRRGSKHVYSRVANDEKECLTVLVNVSANGAVAPPMILYPYKRVPKNLIPSLPSGWGVGNTESGWMNMAAFYEYVTNCFYPWLIKHQIKFPVVLFLDGHTSHISLPLSLFCKEHDIILVALLPNATHILQPLDVAVFRPVKGTWRKIVHDFRVANNFAKLKRTDFAPLIKECFDICLLPETIKSGFRCCGIYPFDPDSVNYNKLLPNNRNKITRPSTEDSSNTEQSSDNEKTDEQVQTFKQLFEDRLSPSVLKMFQESEKIWVGDIAYKKLFEFWRDIKPRNDCEELQLDDTTLINNIGDGTIMDTLTFEIGSIGNLINIPADPSNADKETSCLIPKDGTLIFPLEQVLACDSEKHLSDLVGHTYNESTKNVNNIISNNDDIDSIHDIENQGLITSTPKSITSITSKNVLRQLININPSVDTTIQSLNNSKTPSKCDKTSQNIPNEFNITTPFKNAFFFPEVEAVTTKRVCKRMTPTVATSDEFIAYQKRIDAEKSKKEEKKRKRKEDLEKKKIDKREMQKKSKVTSVKKVKRIKVKARPVIKNVEFSDSQDDTKLEEDIRRLVKPARRFLSLDSSEPEYDLDKCRVVHTVVTQAIVHATESHQECLEEDKKYNLNPKAIQINCQESDDTQSIPIIESDQESEEDIF